MRIRTRYAALAVLLLLLLAACGGGDAGTELTDEGAPTEDGADDALSTEEPIEDVTDDAIDEATDEATEDVSDDVTDEATDDATDEATEDVGDGTDADGGDGLSAEVTLEVPASEDDDETEGTTSYTITCADGEPAPSDVVDDAGYLAAAEIDGEAACATLEALVADHAAEETEEGVMCTQQYGGPHTATVVATDADGEEHTYEFSRTDGCKIAEWDENAALLGEVALGGTSS